MASQLVDDSSLDPWARGVRKLFQIFPHNFDAGVVISQPKFCYFIVYVLSGEHTLEFSLSNSSLWK